MTGGPALEFGTDLNFMRGSGSGEVTGSVVVLAGNLAGAQDLPAEQIAGKHVIIVPVAAAAQGGRGRTRTPRGMTDAEPASVIFVDQNSDEDWATSVESSRNQRTRIMPWSEASGGGLPMLSIRQSSLEPLLAAHGVQLSSHGRGEWRRGPHRRAGLGDRAFHRHSGIGRFRHAEQCRDPGRLRS